MYPGYRFVDAYPRQRNQVPPYMHGYYPSFEVAPSEMKMGPCRPPSPYDAWPHGGTFGHPTPGGCHGCCNHSFMPGYSGFRPPYPQYMQPTPFHGYGGYPMFPESYPMQYMAPPHYPMAQPRYEYDKPKDHHCCGCADHQCNRKEDRPVKIEEQEPDAEKGKSNITSLVPVDFQKDYPYPVMWIPPGYMKNGENRKALELDVKPRDENPRPSEQKPNSQGVWFPFDIKNLGGHVENGQDSKKTEKKKSEDKNEFPFPIFWMPYKPAEEEGKEETESLSGSEPAKTSPTSSGGSTLQPKSIEEGSGTGSLKPAEAKVVKLKTIPVKQLEEPQEKKMKETDGGAKSVKQSSEKKSEHKRESSPPSTSKLPPVCLRVEPLKRRSRSVGSRSPSPPGDKREATRSREMEKHEVERNEGKGQVLERTKSLEAFKSDGATSEAGKGISKEARDQTILKEASNAAIADAAKESLKAVKDRNKSEEDAALIIQAAYRGFEVRKWEPLKKLKQIAMVKEKVTEVKHRIEAFELSSDVSIDNKQKLVIGETIMSLLLKLDTIQGLHPMVREIRKSVAKDLVSLQEKLDSLATEKPAAPIPNPVVGLSADDKDSTRIQEKGEAEATKSSTEDCESFVQADSLQGEESCPSPKAQDSSLEENKECKDSVDKTSESPIGHSEELQSLHEEDGGKSEVRQNDETLSLAVGESVDVVAPSTPVIVDHQESASEESETNEKIETCECEAVQGEENSSPQADEMTSMNSEAAEDAIQADNGATVTETELFVLPPTTEHNVEVSDGASNTNEVIGVTEQAPEPLAEGALEENGTMEAPELVAPQTDECPPVLALEEDGNGTHVGAPQVGEPTTELAPAVPQAGVTFEENVTIEVPKLEMPQENEDCMSVGDASQVEEPNAKDESFKDKEVLIEESEIEGDMITGAEAKIGDEGDEEQPSKEDEVEKCQKLEAAEENAIEDKQSDQKLLEENRRLKKMMEELIEAGKDQLSAITDLSGKVKYLERKLARKKKVKTRRAKSAKERIEDIVV